MGWHINLVKNTVEINSHVALDLYNCDAQVGYCWREECEDSSDLGSIINDGKLVFNYDHMEHMDYVWESEVLEVLCKHKVKGDICFVSHDGDNEGQEWGYRFDGKGNQFDLTRKDGGWEETGTCHPRGKGVETCNKCGSTRFKVVQHKRGPNSQKCAKCGKANSGEWVFPFPGGKVVKDEPKPKKAKRSKELKGVAYAVASEGFDYAFRHYSSFDEVKDPKFHELREAYRTAADALEKYIGPIPEM